jgi:dolichyl-phosphate-mannose-protein mannosyltransferase
MKRQLFLHHYLPALYFAIALLAIVSDILFSRLNPKAHWLLVVAISAVIIYQFYQISPLTYGTQYTAEHCEKIRWVPSWDFACQRGL